MEKIKELSAVADTAIEKGTRVEILYSVQGTLRAKIVAVEMNSRPADENPYSEFPKGVELISYDEKMKITSRMTASYGIYYSKKDEMFARENVVIVNNKNETLNTEELLWKRKEEKIYSDKFVKITTADEIILGTGFEAKQDFSDYTIKNITGTIKVKDAER